MQRCWGGNLAPPRSFPNPFGPLQSPKCPILNMHGCARLSDTGLERSDLHGSEVGEKNDKMFFSKLGSQKSRGANLAPPWSFSNSFGPLESLKCLCFRIASPARQLHNPLERSDNHGSEVRQKNDKMFFSNQVAKSPGGLAWRHRGVFPIRLDRWTAQSVQVSGILEMIHHSANQNQQFWAFCPSWCYGLAFCNNNLRTQILTNQKSEM